MVGNSIPSYGFDSQRYSRSGHTMQWYTPKNEEQQEIFDMARGDIKSLLAVSKEGVNAASIMGFLESQGSTIRFRDLGFNHFNELLFHCQDFLEVRKYPSYLGLPPTCFLFLRASAVDEESAHVMQLVQQQHQDKKRKKNGVPRPTIKNLVYARPEVLLEHVPKYAYAETLAETRESGGFGGGRGGGRGYVSRGGSSSRGTRGGGGYRGRGNGSGSSSYFQDNRQGTMGYRPPFKLNSGITVGGARTSNYGYDVVDRAPGRDYRGGGDATMNGSRPPTATQKSGTQFYSSGGPRPLMQQTFTQGLGPAAEITPAGGATAPVPRNYVANDGVPRNPGQQENYRSEVVFYNRSAQPEYSDRAVRHPAVGLAHVPPPAKTGLPPPPPSRASWARSLNLDFSDDDEFGYGSDSNSEPEMVMVMPKPYNQQSASHTVAPTLASASQPIARPIVSSPTPISVNAGPAQGLPVATPAAASQPRLDPDVGKMMGELTINSETRPNALPTASGSDIVFTDSEDEREEDSQPVRVPNLQPPILNGQDGEQCPEQDPDICFTDSEDEYQPAPVKSNPEPATPTLPSNGLQLDEFTHDPRIPILPCPADKTRNIMDLQVVCFRTPELIEVKSAFQSMDRGLLVNLEKMMAAFYGVCGGAKTLSREEIIHNGYYAAHETRDGRWASFRVQVNLKKVDGDLVEVLLIDDGETRMINFDNLTYLKSQYARFIGRQSFLLIRTYIPGDIHATTFAKRLFTVKAPGKRYDFHIFPESELDEETTLPIVKGRVVD